MGSSQKIIVDDLFSSIRKLELYTTLKVPSKVIFKEANTIDIAEKMWIQVDWSDKAIVELIVKLEHYVLVQGTYF